jgi:hypothetical protein
MRIVYGACSVQGIELCHVRRTVVPTSLIDKAAALTPSRRASLRELWRSDGTSNTTSI